ncbi:MULTISPECIES: YraN family protein [Bacteroidales]|uniref:YraN family protein n=1 Tax=Bacteroidales TaxID=171549 RepID=UPI00258ED9DF|nr:YraN family protein [Xylanibacter rodentium]
MAAGNKEIGRWGEDVACDMLVGLGYAIVERNWRVGHLEIDIVAQKGGRIVFVEVKTRAADSPEDPLDAIDRRKQAHMAAAANAFLRGNHWRGEVQFDLFGIRGCPSDYTVEHIPDAFLPPLKTY